MSTPTEPFCIIRDALGLAQESTDTQVVRFIRTLQLDSARMSQIENETYTEVHKQVDGRRHVATCNGMAAGQSVRQCLDIIAERKVSHD